MAFIDIQDLHYQYPNGVKALNGLNLQIEQGEIFGFLGPNGSGKSTTFKILVGLLEPDQGKALIGGRQVGHQEREVYRNVGYMPDMTDMYDNFTVYEFLRFFGLCHSMTDAKINERVGELLATFRIAEKRDAFMKTLSKGQKQKACIIRTMIHDPKVLFLDEPASGLDPYSRSILTSVLQAELRRNKAVIISSHILPELADLCTVIGILYKGQLIEHGRVDELIEKYQNPVTTYRIQVLEGMNLVQKALQGINDNQLQGTRKTSDSVLILEHAGNAHQIANLLEILVKAGVRISGFEKIEKDIQSIYNEILHE